MKFPSANPTDPFDFDLWAKMARENPERFEEMRRDAIEQTILSAPSQYQERLRRLQWRVDQERRLAGNPLNSCLRISKMMWEKFAGEGGLMDHLEDLGKLGRAEKTYANAPRKDNVLAFARKAT